MTQPPVRRSFEKSWKPTTSSAPPLSTRQLQQLIRDLRRLNQERPAVLRVVAALVQRALVS